MSSSSGRPPAPVSAPAKPKPVDLTQEQSQQAFVGKIQRGRGGRSTILSTMADAGLKQTLGS